ncbi:metallophosphoesterase family protein [Pseudomonas fluorescens]|uniref:metallophosphoesterase n=1 Tax=Pseudomonas TaxID=286 RepID=UPI000F041274|nr:MULTISPECIES: metallophosphoesterase [Pseudomonas]MBD8088724.1 metallophosphoesterase family protein [Pseudomonas fluorescens]MBD8614815.1 metallophosphoesterase family protein [Pseudomonas putida]MBD8681501.1 metallophosphoesterase family protein [Pseudomonas sp. CFBP 13719]
MKNQLISDIHLDVHPMEAPIGGDADACLIAGDLHELDQGIDFIERILKVRPVLHLLGNHDAYTSSIDRVAKLFSQHVNRLKDFYFMDRHTAVLEDVRYIGATLWTDFNRGNPLSIMQATGMVKDYLYINNAAEDDRIRPEEILRRHQLDLAYIRHELEKPWPGKTVVMTHHSPSYQSCQGRFAHSPSNFLYASNLDDIIKGYAPDVWVHGHIHSRLDYHIGATRILCNPRGSRAMEGQDFDPYFTFTLP